jgi:hypothetical protein
MLFRHVLSFLRILLLSICLSISLVLPFVFISFSVCFVIILNFLRIISFNQSYVILVCGDNKMKVVNALARLVGKNRPSDCFPVGRNVSFQSLCRVGSVPVPSCFLIKGCRINTVRVVSNDYNNGVTPIPTHRIKRLDSFSLNLLFGAVLVNNNPSEPNPSSPHPPGFPRNRRLFKRDSLSNNEKRFFWNARGKKSFSYYCGCPQRHLIKISRRHHSEGLSKGEGILEMN